MNIGRKEEKGARAEGSHPARRAINLHQPHLGGVSETLRHRLADNVGYMLLVRRRETSMKKPMLFVSHKAVAYPSDLPGLIKGRSFISHKGPVVTSRGRKGVMSRDVNRLRGRQLGTYVEKQAV